MDIDEEFDLQKGDMKKLKLPWYEKLILKLFPWLFLKRHIKELGMSGEEIDLAEKLFRDRRIDIEPLGAGSRGFIVSLDNKFTLWFYQNGDHFEYDGFEMGKYDNGDVTVFDKLNKE